jgi:SAM-dependent methyltransferase
MDWRIKGIVQKLLSAAPGGARVNSALQRLLGDLRDFEREVRSKTLDDWVPLVRLARSCGPSPVGLRMVEVGTGWFPTLPLCFHLAGASSCTTFDLDRHLNPSLLLRLLHALGPHVPAIAAAAGCDPAVVTARLSRLGGLGSPSDVLLACAIDYRAPADATRTGLAADSVDVVYSNSVLEHVPAQVLDSLMRESFRVLRPGGLALHSVNCGDHYAYFDRSITPINYLRYSERAWRWWNNRLQFQNRLRASDFLTSAERAGLELVETRWRARPELVEALESMRVAPEFAHYPREQLACTSIDFAARKPRRGPATHRRVRPPL